MAIVTCLNKYFCQHPGDPARYRMMVSTLAAGRSTSTMRRRYVAMGMTWLVKRIRIRGLFAYPARSMPLWNWNCISALHASVEWPRQSPKSSARHCPTNHPHGTPRFQKPRLRPDLPLGTGRAPAVAMLNNTITPKPGAMDALTDIVGKMQHAQQRRHR